MAKSKMPPAPAEQRSDKGPGAEGARQEVADTAMAGSRPGSRPEDGRNLSKQDRLDVSKSATHQGYQQDR